MHRQGWQDPKVALGHGIGLRTRHQEALLAAKPPCDWLEVISENLMVPGGRPHAVVEALRREVPIALHGVSLSIGGTDALDAAYLDALVQLVQRYEPVIVSDHLCFGASAGRYAHDLLPLPYTEEALENVVTRVAQVQERLGRQILLENVSSYASFRAATIPEWEFLAEVARRSDCGILLDINNVYVSARNHDIDAGAYFAALPVERVQQLHLAGHTDKGSYLLDSHIGPVPESVWLLYRAALMRFGAVPTLVEWDEEVPPLEVVVAESERARVIEAEVLGVHRSRPSTAARAFEVRSERGAMALAATQRFFFDAVTGAAPIALAELDAHLVGTESLGAKRRLEIYGEMYAARLVDCLRQDFPKLELLLGHEAFVALCRRYFAAHPSTHPSIAHAGRHVAAFLRAEGRDDLADLAELEWARTEIFTAADAVPVGALVLAQLPTETFAEARVRLIPASRLLALGHDVVTTWRHLEEGGDARLEQHDTHVLIWRRDFAVRHVALDLRAARALALAVEGRNLGEICEVFADSPDPVGAALTAIGAWFADGLVAAVD